MKKLQVRTRKERRAVLSWRNGQTATLSIDGWKVQPADPILLTLLERDYSLEQVQARRKTTLPDLLRAAAKAAAACLGAEVEIRFDE